MMPSSLMPTDETPDAHTIDELAALTRVPSRTIRFYQSKGALPAPEIRGRVAYYGAAHVERLKLIGSLQDRGLSIRAIRDLLAQADKGELALNEWLGLERQLQEPWSPEQDQSRIYTEAELNALAGEHHRPGLGADLVRLKQIERQGEVFLVRSPALLQIGLRLDASGIDLETAVGASVILRKSLARAAGELVSFFFRRVGDGFGRDVNAAELGEAYRTLRPVGLEAVRVVFGQEMERAIRKLVESGATSQLPAKAKAKSRSRRS